MIQTAKGLDLLFLSFGRGKVVSEIWAVCMSYSEPLSLLEIHLDRISRNYLALQKRLVRGADCAAVVKADAYGLGAAVVVPELYKANCRHFYVVHASEGV